MKALIVGAAGQLGRELIDTCPASVEIHAVMRTQLDVSDRAGVMAYLKEHRPDLVLNAAAYTAVDGAECKPDRALAVNGAGAENIAYAADEIGARLFHISTDFVFDGSASQPYKPQHEPRPLGVYGHSKLAGERRVLEIQPMGALVVRTAWVYSRYGNNFVKTMLKLMAERPTLSVVDDQVGAPTWARGLAAALWQFSEVPEAHGIYHWTDTGQCSWYEFAVAIYEEGRRLGLLDNEVEISPIPTEDYPTPARRPAYSVLDCSGTHCRLDNPGRDWRAQLTEMLESLV